MSQKSADLQRLIDCGVIAILRAPTTEQARQLASAVNEGGIVGLEVALTTPGAVPLIRELSGTLGDRARIGAGTVLNARQAHEALEAGARFIASPAYDPQVLQVTLRAGVVAIPGALTPAEILNAWRAGADLVQVFPSASVGPAYFRDLLRSLPHLRLMAVGGVRLRDVAEWIRSGAMLVGVGADLVLDGAVERGDWKAVARRVKDFVTAVQAARAQPPIG
ncbi:MAG: bifunctional 4-hydroxy-2-oxoglutarate aldolase/2-dehydro-3-deoxy-phosphogluconate aldolase [Phycisphaerae bacterium]|nr:bifunctional 4-hydroxy-2-oxoglutarate aldolase/2-dehydro-3-deoxy-phosphogluconate aldolase [Phycisphaerae bacterium]